MIRKGSMIRASELGLKAEWYVHNHPATKALVQEWISGTVVEFGVMVATCTGKG